MCGQRPWRSAAASGQVLLAAISVRVIRGHRVSTDGTWRFGLCRDELLIAAAAAGYEPEARSSGASTGLPAADGRPGRRNGTKRNTSSTDGFTDYAMRDLRPRSCAYQSIVRRR